MKGIEREEEDLLTSLTRRAKAVELSARRKGGEGALYRRAKLEYLN